MEVLASLEDLRVENRRLAERERQLQASLDQSEDQLRSLQTEKSALLSQLNKLVLSRASESDCMCVCVCVCVYVVPSSSWVG